MCGDLDKVKSIVADKEIIKKKKNVAAKRKLIMVHKEKGGDITNTNQYLKMCREKKKRNTKKLAAVVASIKKGRESTPIRHRTSPRQTSPKDKYVCKKYSRMKLSLKKKTLCYKLSDN